MIKRDGVRIQKRKRAAAAAHICEALYHEPLHDASAGILGVCAYARYEPDWKDRAVYIHIERVYRKLRDEGLAVEAAEYVCTLKDGEFRLLYLIVAPSCLGKILLGDLKCVSQQGVVLVEVGFRRRKMPEFI